eukprot:scaffold2025_cov48-Attheya_sp.AAC.1
MNQDHRNNALPLGVQKQQNDDKRRETNKLDIFILLLAATMNPHTDSGIYLPHLSGLLGVTCWLLVGGRVLSCARSPNVGEWGLVIWEVIVVEREMAISSIGIKVVDMNLLGQGGELDVSHWDAHGEFVLGLGNNSHTGLARKGEKHPYDGSSAVAD